MWSVINPPKNSTFPGVMLLQRKKNCILEGICHRKHCWRWLLCSACLVTCQLECCHPHLNASLGRKQVNQGKSALNHRSLFFLTYENWIWFASISLIPLKGKPSEAQSICRGQQFLNPKADQQTNKKKTLAVWWQEGKHPHQLTQHEQGTASPAPTWVPR